MYSRFTLAFVPLTSPSTVIGSVEIELTAEQLADPNFLRIVLAEQLKRRGPSHAKAILLRGKLSDAEACVALASGAERWE